MCDGGRDTKVREQGRRRGGGGGGGARGAIAPPQFYPIGMNTITIIV